jgi:hypothetical protein
MGFLDKAKAAAGQAAAKAKQGAQDVQLKVDLSAAYDELGKATFELVEAGELEHPKLEEPAAKIRELRARKEGAEAGAEPTPEAVEPPVANPDAPAT